MKLLLIAVILLAGCATKEMTAEEKAFYAQCLPHTGCPLNTETEDQFEKRKELEAQTDQENAAKKAKNDQIAKECQWEVAKAMGSGNYAYNAYMAGVNAMADTFREVRLMRQCLEAKGYQG